MSKKEIELVCVTKNNNNKYYKMKDNEDGTFTVKYGRVGGRETVQSYPIQMWESKYKQKLKKRKDYQYQDISHLRSDAKTADFKPEKSKNAQAILDTLQGFSNQSIKNNYTISAASVTKAQVDKAQALIDDLTAEIISRKRSKLAVSTIDTVNDMCTELYTTIPRKMKHVKDYLLDSSGRGSKQDALDIIANEQDLLDVMAQQVSMNTSASTNPQTMSEALGIDVTLASASENTKIKKMMSTQSSRFVRAYKLINLKTQDRFEKQLTKSFDDSCKLLWHGSRNENWLNIVKTGLLIRPSGVVLTGAMFGNGIYMADKAQKSIGYTSARGSYWARGSSNKAFLALYEVNTGKELRQMHHKSWMYDLDNSKLKRRGKYDSLFAEGGADLRNNEYIVYNKDQCTIKYLVEIK